MAENPTLYYRHAGHVYQITLSPQSVVVERHEPNGTHTAKSLKFSTIQGLRHGKSWNESAIDQLIVRYERQIASEQDSPPVDQPDPVNNPE